MGIIKFRWYLVKFHEYDYLFSYRNKRRIEKSNGEKSEPGDVRLENEDISTANTASLSSSMQP